MGRTLQRLAKALLPQVLWNGARDLRQAMLQRYYSRLSRKDVFRHVYQSNAWGGRRGTNYSGPGSDDEYGAPYARAMREVFARLEPRRLVDLGCGDFRVGEKLLDETWEYVGVDIVEQVVLENRQRFGRAGVEFACLDICADPLPDGDVVLIRQVLQHLSNADIALVLPKLRKFSWALVTEHIPTHMAQPNLDKPSGPTIRTKLGSGVVLHQAPFDFPVGQLVWEMRLGTEAFSGERLVTYLYDLRTPLSGEPDPTRGQPRNSP